MIKVVLDPGHGGSDPGAVGNGLFEKDLNLTIAKEIRYILLNEYEGVEVKLTRETDLFIDLPTRAMVANDISADFFVSIHINSSSGGGTGFESYIHETRSLNSTIYQEVIHAEIMKEICHDDIYDRGKKHANFSVLRRTSMPAVLTENLFINNKHDADKLSDHNFLKKVAKGHANGIAKIFNLKRKTESDKQNTTSFKNKSIKVTSTKVTVNGKEVNGSFIYGNTTYVPVREVAESLGAEVKWTGKEVIISKK